MGDGTKEGAGTVVLAFHSGTYGRTDDVCGGLILANSLLTRGLEVTILLRGEGVYIGVKDQDANAIGYESHQTHLEDAVEMGARVVALRGSLEERGLSEKDLGDYVEVVGEDALPALMEECDHWMPF